MWGRLAFDVQRFRRGHLHAVRQLEALDSCGQFGFVGVPLEVLRAEPHHQVELRALPLVVERVGALEVLDWVARGT